MVHEANQYRLLFTRALGELCRILKEQENYQELIALTAKAIQAFPDEQWFIFQIEAFLALNQFDRAYQTYEYAVKVLVDDMDLTPSDRLRDVFRGLNKKVDKSLETIKEIRDKLQDTIEPGRAYYCTFPSFIDAYRLSGRIMKRSRIPSFLILCTLTDSRGEKITDKKKLEKVSAQLKDTLMTSVRSSDMLTQYNMSQYLLLLNGIVREDCSIVTSRISRRFKKQNPSPNYFVNFYVSSVLDAPPISIITVDGQGK